jgi:hypothetical protein
MEFSLMILADKGYFRVSLKIDYFKSVDLLLLPKILNQNIFTRSYGEDLLDFMEDRKRPKAESLPRKL